MDQSRYDQKLEHILRTSARIFAEKSYHSTSMRDIARATGVSLAGLYHYCKSKEELLFLIQDHCFGRVLERLQERIEGVTEPVEKLRILIDNHLAFFAANMAEMKVLSHEAESLSGEKHAHVSSKKEKYTRIARKILTEIRRTQADGATVDLTVATYSLFGMMNWIYNWYNPRGKIKVNDLVDNVSELFLSGFIGCAEGSDRQPRTSRKPRSASIWRVAGSTGLALLLLTAGLLFHAANVNAQQPAQPPRKPCFGSPVYGGNLDYQPVSEEPRVGNQAKDYPKSVNGEPAPKGMLTVFRVTFDEIKFSVYVDNDGLIQRVSTNDSKFKTSDGVTVGDTAEKVVALSKKPLKLIGDCFYSITLPSGWEANLGADSVGTDGGLVPHSKVISLQMTNKSQP